MATQTSWVTTSLLELLIASKNNWIFRYVLLGKYPMTRFPLKNKLKSFFTNSFICLPGGNSNWGSGWNTERGGGSNKGKKKAFLWFNHKPSWIWFCVGWSVSTQISKQANSRLSGPWLITRQLYSHSPWIVHVYTQSGAQHSQNFRYVGMSVDIAGWELPCRIILFYSKFVLTLINPTPPPLRFVGTVGMLLQSFVYLPSKLEYFQAEHLRFQSCSGKVLWVT